MSLDAVARRAAVKLIDRYGKSVVLTTITPGSYSPATGAAAPSGKKKPIKALIEDYKGFDLNDLVLQGDKKVTVAAAPLTVEPKPTDIVTIGKIAYTAKAVQTIMSGELPALYVIQARKE